MVGQLGQSKGNWPSRAEGIGTGMRCPQPPCESEISNVKHPERNSRTQKALSCAGTAQAAGWRQPRLQPRPPPLSGETTVHDSNASLSVSLF